MANETTTSSAGHTSRVLTEALGALAFQVGGHPKAVVGPLCNQDSIDGLPTQTKQYVPRADQGAASSATEGTAIANAEHTMGTAITASPGEYGINYEITEKLVRHRFPGYSAQSVVEIFARENPDEIASVCMEPAQDQYLMLAEAAEDACANLLSGGSNTVGSTGVDLTVSTLVNAIYTMKTLEPAHEDWAFVLTPNQILEIQLELGITSGGLGGSVWMAQGDVSMFNHLRDLPRNGFRGSFLGIPVYEYSHSLRTLMNTNADVAGALLCRGVGAVDAPGAQVGAFSFVEGAPMIWRAQKSADGRALNLVATYEFAAVENDDDNLVTIVSDAP
jgi:hypothetical protein